MFRGDASLLPGNPWQNVVCNGALGTSPHADSRDMEFDANGNLLQANDGGIFRLANPNTSATRQWGPVVGNIRPNELHSVAFDPLSKVTFGGAQDTGTPIQSTPGSFTWNELTQGDGGAVAVDADQTAHPGTTIRYTGFTGLPGFRTTWNASNVRIGGFTALNFLITSGPGSGQTINQFDPNIQFYNPYVLNAINPTRMLVGTENIYESMNQGDTVANLVQTGQFIGGNFSFGQPLAFGGRLSGTAFPDVFSVGAGATIYHRVSGSIATLPAYNAAGGGTVHTIVMKPQNYRQVFVVDSNNRVWGSFDEGASWIELTANLGSLTSQVDTIQHWHSQRAGAGPPLRLHQQRPRGRNVGPRLVDAYQLLPRRWGHQPGGRRGQQRGSEPPATSARRAAGAADREHVGAGHTLST